MVCKTITRRFESDPRLQIFRGLVASTNVSTICNWSPVMVSGFGPLSFEKSNDAGETFDACRSLVFGAFAFGGVAFGGVGLGVLAFAGVPV
jgi:hypothetical protein